MGIRYFSRVRRERFPSKLTDSSYLADPRQLLTEHHVDNPRAADAGFYQDHSRMLADDFSNNLSVTPKWMFAHAL
jgi:hypothetical protein